VKLLGHEGPLQWKQEADGLAITCPADMPFATAVTFCIE
jgi:alpha-L-fucosidase